ncbi:MAG: hypothetical protein QOI76_2479, partial [Frankiales bacterium]|nr:hypothetical protein [Frankiales bacterium]
MNHGVQQRWTGLAASALLILAACAASSVASVLPAAASARTSISIDGSRDGPVFGGIGALSAGGSTRLLVDYPPKQRSTILDYLFKPGVGAALQILKVEIGGGTNSTDGAESSTEAVEGQVTCNTGYEWWLMEQATRRNPHITLYAEAWGAPGWVGEGAGTLHTASGIRYTISWLRCAQQHGLSIDYLGGWNERPYSLDWYKQLRSALDSNGFRSVKIVGGDGTTWSIAADVARDPALAKVLAVLGTHYPCEGGDGGTATTCFSPASALAAGKPLWASENGSLPLNTGAPAMVRTINRGYVDGRLTASVNWPLVGAIYQNLAYGDRGLLLATQPWSGHYTLGLELWATAQYTRFTAPGWRFVEGASGYLGGTESNGSYVTLRRPGGRDYTTVVETTTAREKQAVRLHVGGGLSTATVHVYGTDLRSSSPSRWFMHVTDLAPGHGSFGFIARPGWVYTLSTLSSSAKPVVAVPASGNMTLPYADSYDHEAVGSAPRYLANQQGDFQVRPCAAGRPGRCVRQMTPERPVEWDGDSSPYATLGGIGWTDYTVSTDVLLEQAGAVQLFGRVGSQARAKPAAINAYVLQVDESGRWAVLKRSTAKAPVVLAAGRSAPFGTGT